MNITLFVLFSLIITIAYFIQGVTGFGSAIFALPLVSIFLPLNAVVPTLLVLSVVQNTMIVIRDKKYISKKIILKIILLILIGIPFGIISFNVLPENILKLLLSFLIVYFAISKLIKSKKVDKINSLDFLYLIFGGCIQGAFGTGGPLIVVYFVKRIHDKKIFRVTMCLIFTIINTIIILQKLIIGSYTTEVKTLIGCGILSVIIGTFLGNTVHDNISQEKFSKISYVILLFSGISLFLNTIY